MVDVVRRLKKTREEVAKFQRSIHEKMLKRQKFQEEVKNMEREIARIKEVERNLLLKKSLLSRLELDINRLGAQRKRLVRELPGIERELRKIKRERVFGGM